MIEKWSKQLIQGLNFLHNNSIMHRDIKPELVFNFIN
jgi:serine/threonine protein kinase